MPFRASGVRSALGPLGRSLARVYSPHGEQHGPKPQICWRKCEGDGQRRQRPANPCESQGEGLWQGWRPQADAVLWKEAPRLQRKHQGKKAQSAHAQPPLMPELTQSQGHWEAKAPVQIRHLQKPSPGDGELELRPGTAYVQIDPDRAQEKQCRPAAHPFGGQAQKLTNSCKSV